MTTKEFDALVNKGAITQVGIVEDAEKLDTQDFASLHMTQHEAVAEVLAETSDNNETEDVATPEEEPVAAMNEVPTEVPAGTVEPTPAVIEDAPVAEETPAPAAKKSKKAKNVAPSVDPVE